MNTEEEYTKVLFRFYSDVLEEETVETMWARVINPDEGLYKLDSIPFYAPLIASDDIVHAVYDADEEMLTYKKTVQHSGNSTIQVIVLEKAQSANDIRIVFENMGCISEKFNEKYFVIEVPAEKDYTIIRNTLNELENKGIISYAESCLSHKHKY